LTLNKSRLAFVPVDQSNEQTRGQPQVLMHRIFPEGVAPELCCGQETHFSVAAQRACRRWRLWGCSVGLAMLGCAGVWAQDAFRASLAGQAAAEAKKRAAENQRYNVKLGPVSLRLVGQLGLEGTDNVKYETDENAEADFIFRPQLNLTALWRVTEKNSLNLALGFGYD